MRHPVEFIEQPYILALINGISLTEFFVFIFCDFNVGVADRYCANRFVNVIFADIGDGIGFVRRDNKTCRVRSGDRFHPLSTETGCFLLRLAT
jgi:hypothetical protein